MRGAQLSRSGTNDAAHHTKGTGHWANGEPKGGRGEGRSRKSKGRAEPSGPCCDTARPLLQLPLGQSECPWERGGQGGQGTSGIHFFGGGGGKEPPNNRGHWPPEPMAHQKARAGMVPNMMACRM